jgi:predicted nucleic acid-binding protein
LSKLKYRQAAVELLQSLEDDPTVEVVPLTEELYERAVQLYGGRADKEWGLTDCVSFIVMQERGLTEALTGRRTLQPSRLPGAAARGLEVF